MKKRILLTLIILFLSSLLAYSKLAYKYTCRFSNSAGVEITIAYNGDACGMTTSWSSMKIFPDGSAVVENSSMYGQFNMGNFPCCNPGI